jgi:biopolymer transport protein ExbB
MRPDLASRFRLLLGVLLVAGVAIYLQPYPASSSLWAQDAGAESDAGQQDAAGPSPPPPAAADEAETDTDQTAPAGSPREGLSLLWLIGQGGPLMVPIYLMSILVVAVVIERSLGLRTSKVMPSELVSGLGELGNSPGGFDPRKAYRLSQEHPSPASTVIRAMLLKVGRPHSEVEHAVAEASEREATRLYANVRWLNLATAVTPLMGLFGTVWGMIQAFFDTTRLTAGQNKAELLAHGIYVALVTTLGGLAVAIPAAICAHFFEGRIQTLFHQIDELLFNLLPQIERYEGRLRVSRQALGEGDADLAAAPRSAARESTAAVPAAAPK